MRGDGLFGFTDEFYRSKQTNATTMLLAERQTDILSALLHLCQENGVTIPEGVIRSMAEVESLFKRVALINSLPVHELLRLPPLRLSPDDSSHRDDPTESSQSPDLFC